MKKFAVFAILMALSGAAHSQAETAAVPAAPTGEKQPTVITSDGPLEVDNKQKTAYFQDNVIVTDAQGQVHADTMRVFFTPDGKDINEIHCKGNVKIYQEDRNSRSDEAVFYAAEQKLILTGNPEIQQGEDLYRADKITIFTAQNRVLFEPSAQLLIYPDKDDKEKSEFMAQEKEE